MEKKVRIKAGQVEVKAELNDTKTAQVIWEALPIEGRGNRWGDEIYFSIPIDLGPEDAKDVVSVGDLGYWPQGNGFCIFFGPTPMSSGADPVPASPCNVFGKVIGDATVLRQVPSGAEVTIEKED
jgi:hypothetical protein